MKFTPTKNKAAKLVYLSLGTGFSIIGVIGVLLPVIPGFIFLVPAAVCFAKASERMHGWFSRSKRFGKYFK